MKLKALPQWIAKGKFLEFTLTAFTALTLALLAGWLAYNLSREFYAIAPYHYDSAAYRMFAYRAYQQSQSAGVLPAILTSLRDKDNLDILLRLLLAPQLLTQAYGHLPILLVFLALYLGLLIWYIRRQAGSWLLSLGLSLLVFSFPFLYNPSKGIADYWVDDLGAWLIGAAVVCWLLANHLRLKHWSMLCSLLLALTLMERAVIAVYAAPIFLLAFLATANARVRDDGLGAASRDLAAFVLPALIVGGITAVLRWHELYVYYYERGYDFGSRLEALNRLMAQIRSDSGLSLPLMAVLILGGLFASLRLKRQNTQLLFVLLVVIALPVEMIASAQYYHSFYTLWAPLMLITAVVIICQLPVTLKQNRWANYALLLITFGAALIQEHVSSAQAQELAAAQSPVRQTYSSIVQTIVHTPGVSTVALLFDQIYDPIMNHVVFDEGHPLLPAIGVYSHDSYYRVEYGASAGIAEISKQLICQLYKLKPELAFAFANPDSVDRLPNLAEPSTDQVSKGVIRAMSRYLWMDPHWKTIREIDSPYGAIIVYTYDPQPQGNSYSFRLYLPEVLNNLDADIPVNAAGDSSCK